MSSANEEREGDGKGKEGRDTYFQLKIVLGVFTNVVIVKSLQNPQKNFPFYVGNCRVGQ